MKESRRDMFKQIYHNDLGICGCGLPVQVAELVSNILTCQEQLYTENKSVSQVNYEMRVLFKNVGVEVLKDLILHMFSNAGIVDHGVGIGSSYMTNKGKSLIELIREFKDEL